MCADDKLTLEAYMEKLGMGLELATADRTLESSGGRGQPGPAGPTRSEKARLGPARLYHWAGVEHEF